MTGQTSTTTRRTHTAHVIRTDGTRATIGVVDKGTGSIAEQAIAEAIVQGGIARVVSVEA